MSKEQTTNTSTSTENDVNKENIFNQALKEFEFTRKVTETEKIDVRYGGEGQIAGMM